MEYLAARLMNGDHNGPPTSRHHLQALQDVQRGGRVKTWVMGVADQGFFVGVVRIVYLMWVRPGR